MLANATITVFENNGMASNPKFTSRHTINNVYWNDSRGQTTTKNGIQITDSVTVYVYSDEYIPKKEDIIVRNVCDFVFDNSSQKAVSESMKKFRESCPDFAVVKSVNNCMFGGLPHIEILAR